jgi:hypothetical protein
VKAAEGSATRFPREAEERKVSHRPTWWYIRWRGLWTEDGRVFALLQGQEVVIILVIGLLVLGGSQLPKLIRALTELREDPDSAGEAQGSDQSPDDGPGREKQ